MHSEGVIKLGASDAVEHLLGPVSLPVFAAEYLGERFLHVPGRPGKFTGLFNWKDLNTVLRIHRPDVSHIKLAKDGEFIPRDRFLVQRRVGGSWLEPNAVNRELHDGATLIVDGIDLLHEPVTQLAEALEERLQCGVGVNMYAGWRASRGFDLHWDDHDVFILQIFGRKRWQVYHPTRRYPLESERTVATIPKPDGDPVWAAEIDVGEVLYIPRGWWHVAVPCDVPTLHLTIGLYYPKALDMVGWVVGNLRSQDSMRMDVHCVGGIEARNRYYLEVQNALVAAFSDPALADKFLKHLDSARAPRPTFGLPYSVVPTPLDSVESKIRLLPRAPLQIEALEDEETISVAFRGEAHVFRREAGPVLSMLAGRGALPVRELYEAFADSIEREQMETFVSDLAIQGLAVLESQ